MLLGGLYVLTDPYKTLHPFSLEYYDDTNRDYLSSELWLENFPSEHYDSYIFGSSRACGLNSYHWLKYLPKGSRQFLFQGWGETITGMEQKIAYIDRQGLPIRNVLLLIDYPGAFVEKQVQLNVLDIKHPTFAGRPKWMHECILFWWFIQKPSQWARALKQSIHPEKPFVCFDPVSNDWDAENRYRDLSAPPQKDSLKNCSDIAKKTFLKENQGKTDKDLSTSEPIINDNLRKRLVHIRNIFEKSGTDYRIIISPGYCYSDPKINPDDLEMINNIFGTENVYDFSGKNCLTEDYNNYSDPGHFGLWVGWHIIEEIYNIENE